MVGPDRTCCRWPADTLTVLPGSVKLEALDRELSQRGVMTECKKRCGIIA